MLILFNIFWRGKGNSLTVIMRGIKLEDIHPEKYCPLILLNVLEEPLSHLLGLVVLLLTDVGLRLAGGRWRSSAPAAVLGADLSLDLLRLLQLADGAVVVRPLRAVVRGCRPAATRHRGRGLLRLLGTRRMLEKVHT